MYSKFKDLLAKKDRGELRTFVEKSSADELSKLISGKICDAEAPRILDELLGGFTESETSQAKRQKFVEAVLRSLRKAKVTTSHVDSIVNRIVLDFTHYNKSSLVKIVEFCLERITLNDDDLTSWKDILPAALESLEDEKYVNYKGNEVPGSECKTLVVKSICNASWDNASLIPLAKMFGEIALDKDDHELVIRSLCDKVPDVELNEIPPLVHQLLRLYSNQDGRLILGTLQKYFSTMYAEAADSQNAESFDEIGSASRKDIEEIESTVLYHIYQAAQVNHANFKDFINSLKKVTNAPEYILDPFLMAVLLSVSSIYDDQIFEILRNAMCRKILDDEKRKSSAWLRSVLSDDWRIVDVVEQVIVNSNKDRHLVLNGLVEFAFVLMSGERRPKDDDNLYDIGIRIIQKLIRKRHEIGARVLQKLTDKIIAGGSMISQYTECLSYMCRKLTLIVRDSQAWVIALLEQLLAIPGDAATQVLYAILPLMPVSATIRDSLVLVLRKALYRKGTLTRQMAVIGFLQLLKNLKINNLNVLSQSGQSSSASSSASIFTQATIERRAQTKTAAPCNTSLCHEVLSILKRCFTHEVDVRLHLYKGLHDGVVMNPELSDYVIDMLITHFNIYHETDLDVKPPLKFHICSDIHGPEAVLQEPIGDLIFVMQRIYTKMASKNSSSLDRVSIILESLCKRMIHTELEHLNLDDRTDLLDNVPKSQQKLHSLKLMITVYEALMAYKIGGWSTASLNVAQNINSLFKNYKELVDFSKRLGKGKKTEGKNKNKDPNDTTANKKAGRPASVKLPNTIMDLDTIHKMLSLLYEPSVPWATKEQAAVLKKRTDFHHYTLQTASQLFLSAKTLKNADLQRHQDSYFKDYLDIGQLLYKEIVSQLDTVRNFDQQTGVLGLECFKDLCDLVCTSFPSELPKFLNRICDIEASRGLSVQIQGLISPLQVLAESYFQEDIADEVIPKKIPAIILDLMSILLHKMSFEDNRGTSTVFEWLKNLARTTEVESSIAILFVQILSMIEERDAENGETIDEICVELCGKLGTIDKSEVSIEGGFRCLTEISAAQIHPILSAAIKSKLNNAAWLLDRLKAEHCIACTPGCGDEKEREKLRNKERSLCRQVSYIINTLQSLASVAIEPGTNTDATFKNLQYLYKLISNLTKYFLGKSTAQNPAFQAVKFIQLVELAGKPLKLTFYNLISYTEENQNHRKGKADSHAQRNKVIKETKTIPNVVLAIEIFHKDIMQLSRKTGIPLENYVKQSITRDFRIKNPELVEGLEKLDVSLAITQNSGRVTTPHFEETRNENGSEESDNDEPPAKIKKK